MTTTVKIEAHCSSDKEVFVAITDGDSGDTFTLQDGETAERYVYDNRYIAVSERIKQ